ncbi:MAG: hypothetical protein ACP5O7_02185 [Phycisphaerae bacterium]
MKSPLSHVHNHLPLRQIISGIVLAACASLMTGCGDTRFHFFGHGHVTAPAIAPIATKVITKNSEASTRRSRWPTVSPPDSWPDRPVVYIRKRSGAA